MQLDGRNQPKAPAVYFHMRVNLLPIIEAERRHGETGLETLRRLMVHNALEMARGHQANAAFLAHEKPRTFRNWVQDLGLRPIDAIMRMVASHGRSA
jgi:hypothetical protein